MWVSNTNNTNKFSGPVLTTTCGPVLSLQKDSKPRLMNNLIHLSEMVLSFNLSIVTCRLICPALELCTAEIFLYRFPDILSPMRLVQSLDNQSINPNSICLASPIRFRISLMFGMGKPSKVQGSGGYSARKGSDTSCVGTRHSSATIKDYPTSN
jgi:hypothetical protein